MATAAGGNGQGSGPAVSEEQLQEADALKAKANAFFKENKYNDAVEHYTKALELNPNSAILYSNRAFAHIKMENYGSAIMDAGEAIKIDASYVKGYYRRADANLALAKFKEALKDFNLAAKVAPRDPDLRSKRVECEKMLKRKKFEEALAGPDEPLVSETIDLAEIVVDDDYAGPRMPQDDEGNFYVSEAFVVEAMEHFKTQKQIHRRFVLHTLLRFQALMKELPALVDVPVGEKVTVCGDTHGQFYDLHHIFELNGNPSAANPYVFNGDFVDRGSFSVEVILTLMLWKLADPSCMHLTRGNHEAKSLNRIYGFEGEVKAKYTVVGGKIMDVFRETFCWLPLAICLQKQVLVLHGGLFSSDDVTLDDIRKIERFTEPPETGLMCEILWSDPQNEQGRAPSRRGCGIQFGPDVTKDFLTRNGLKLLVRSHEVKDAGYEVAHDGYCVTVFSAPNYCDNMNNKGAFITFNGDDMVPHFTQFSAVPHPDVKPMAYANTGLFGFL